MATLPLEIPALGISEVNATVPAELGNVIVTSAVDAGPISVTAFVPLSVSSLNKIEPAADYDTVNIGAVKLLFVRVSVVALPTNVSVDAGRVNVLLPSKSACAGACISA